mmetsp:Transcript_38570/g.92930  ORF Transcript_38570/g.92930 Transcript_38570/m.92930 type:complete len:264 (-) Transcript_38570:2-793(-)
MWRRDRCAGNEPRSRHSRDWTPLMLLLLLRPDIPILFLRRAAPTCRLHLVLALIRFRAHQGLLFLPLVPPESCWVQGPESSDIVHEGEVGEAHYWGSLMSGVLGERDGKVVCFEKSLPHLRCKECLERFLCEGLVLELGNLCSQPLHCFLARDLLLPFVLHHKLVEQASPRDPHFVLLPPSRPLKARPKTPCSFAASWGGVRRRGRWNKGTPHSGPGQTQCEENVRIPGLVCPTPSISLKQSPWSEEEERVEREKQIIPLFWP